MRRALELLGNRSNTQSVDVEGIGKPSSFDSDIKKFNGWAFKLGEFLEGAQVGMKQAMEHVQDQDEKISDAASFLDVDMYFPPVGDRKPDSKEIVGQLYTGLAQLCDCLPIGTTPRQLCHIASRQMRPL